MIAEIALTWPEKKGGSPVRRTDVTSHSDFIRDTVHRINEVPLSELESRLPEYIRRRNQNAFVLGGVLERIRRERFWNPGSKRAKNALFERWVERTCHYSGRKARYLISVYLGLVQAAVPASTVAELGWSKLRLIAPILKPVRGKNDEVAGGNRADNEALLQLAQRKSRRELEVALRHASTSDQLSTAKVTRRQKRYSFEVETEAACMVDAALEAIAKETGHSGGTALLYMASAIGPGGQVPLLEHMMKKAGSRTCLDMYVRLFGNPPTPYNG